MLAFLLYMLGVFSGLIPALIGLLVDPSGYTAPWQI